MAFNFKKLNILLVEDSPPMLKIMAAVLQALEVGRVDTAENGERGFELFCEYNYDVVITDWQMEPMDGIELTKKIRMDSKSPNRKVPIILASGHIGLEWVNRARDSGVSELLIKPFSANDLAKRISYVVNKPRKFVECSAFFGPERRRKDDPAYHGGERREDEV